MQPSSMNLQTRVLPDCDVGMRTSAMAQKQSACTVWGADSSNVATKQAKSNHARVSPAPGPS